MFTKDLAPKASGSVEIVIGVRERKIPGSTILQTASRAMSVHCLQTRAFRALESSAREAKMPDSISEINKTWCILALK